MTSDFFLEEADQCHSEVWDIIRARSDVIFFLLTKRSQRVRKCLPSDWSEGWKMYSSMSAVRIRNVQMKEYRS